MKEDEMADSRILMPGADDAYRQSRQRLREAEIQLRDRIEEVAAMRRALPLGPIVKDYEFTEGGDRLRLSDLFAPDKPQLILYHLMYWSKEDEFCNMCSTWIDGFNGITPHVTQRVNFGIASRAPSEILRAWAKRRGWDRLRLLSSSSEFARDIGAEDENGDPDSTIVVFVKDGDRIRHTYTAHAMLEDRQRGIDLLSPVWNLLDLTPGGRGEDWYPSNDAFDAWIRANSFASRSASAR
jgi:predicted dithiol-disulfide oxidoreductase (DUF899 family)